MYRSSSTLKCIVLYLTIVKCFSQHEPFRNASSVLNHKRKGRIWCEIKVKDYQRGWWSGPQRGKSVPQRGTYGFKGSQLSHKGPDMGNKEVQPIRGSKRTEGSGRECRQNEITTILHSMNGTLLRLTD